MDSINAPIHYSFLSGNPPNYRDFFEINQNTGAVKQIRAVDTTVTKKFDIIIKVTIYLFIKKITDTENWRPMQINEINYFFSVSKFK